jgi:predicted esterase
MSTHFLRTLSALALALVVGAPDTLAQALPNINSLRVQYNTRKTSAKPEGELKVQIDQIDREIAEATRFGRLGEVRRLFAKGLALLAGRPWTDVDEFQSSLVIRTTAVVVDSSMPQTFRLEQIFSPDATLSQPLTAVASIRPQIIQAPGAAAAPPPPPPIELGRFEGVPRDLRESPLVMDLDLSKVVDGPHVLEVAVKDGERALGTATLRVAINKGVTARLRQLESDAATAPAEVRADLRYPADYVRKINRGLIELGTFNVGTELTAAEGIAAAAKGGKNPFAGHTGGFERHYVLESAGEIMPYRVYVPTTYTPARAYPLIVALHGLGQTEDSFMDAYAKTVPTQAEQRGYIVVAPLGFRVDGFYGFALSTDADAGNRRRVELSEQDVLEVLKRARADYKIDEFRIYLMGHSMGAIGTWSIAAKHPAIWAAAAAFSGLGNPTVVEKMRHIPQYVVHGDADPTVNVGGSRSMVEAMKKAGVDYVYIEVPGGNHTDVVVPSLPGAFDFFDKKRKAPATTQQ